ncbi:MAG: ribonuclease E/G, partial [Candidatus Accumulibacter phosphatis]|nr:ribonuclease E/G [Candidatus Accumulibacter phosphatis]
PVSNGRRRGRRGGRRERGERVESPAEIPSGESVETSTAIAGTAVDMQGAALPATATSQPARAAVAPTADQQGATAAVTAGPAVTAELPAAAAEAPPATPEVVTALASAAPATANQGLDAEAPMAVDGRATVDTAADMEAPKVAPAADMPAATALPASVDILQAEPNQVLAQPAASLPAPPTLQQLVAESGLIMVETSRDDTRGAPPETIDDSPLRQPRRRRAPVVVSEEPLVMVETQK